MRAASVPQHAELFLSMWDAINPQVTSLMASSKKILQNINFFKIKKKLISKSRKQKKHNVIPVPS